MKILVACEESQEVCKAFRDKGHEAYSCDIIEPSGGHPEWHVLGDAIDTLKGGVFQTMDGKLHAIWRWDIAICHPPCTYLSNAGACRMYKRIDGKQFIYAERFEQMKKARKFFMAMFDANADKIAVENPTPMKICELPPASQCIQPYEYGHPYSKRTLLWLVNLPKLKPTNVLQEHTPFLPSNTSAYAKGCGGSRGAVRGSKNYAKTFPGIAKAMAEQWGKTEEKT